jgi:DNA-binding NarL/FixJ family response regulator
MRPSGPSSAAKRPPISADRPGRVPCPAYLAQRERTFGAQTFPVRALVRLPEGNELSARQSEIVARLIAGERVPQIARSMFLSATTVRNHLSVIYRKFGVHSQSELLATLLRTVVLHDA